MIITISGVPGSGKTSIASGLAKKMGWPYYDIGYLRRQKAKKIGLTLTEYNKMGENDPKTDLEVDKYQKKLGEEKDNFIICGRTSWNFIPHSIKIFLDVEAEEGARRVWKELQKKNHRNEDNNLKSISDVIISHQKRRQSDIKRYKKYFNIDVFDRGNYDLVVNTTELDKKKVLDKIYKYIKSSLPKKRN